MYYRNQIPQRQYAKKRAKFSEQGLTIMESLVAIVMIAAVSVSLTPPIFLTVATRVQNRRAEQAMNLAHGEIDRVRVLMEQGVTQNNVEQLPGLDGSESLENVPAPSSIHGGPESQTGLQSTNFTCSEYDKNYQQLDSTTALKVDVNGDCEYDFLVQTFRIREQTTGGQNPIPLIFRMGVRVYSRVAEDSSGALLTEEASLQLTTGEGQQDTRPLAVMYTDLGQADLDESLVKYHCFVAGGGGEMCE